MGPHLVLKSLIHSGEGRKMFPSKNVLILITGTCDYYPYTAKDTLQM